MKLRVARHTTNLNNIVDFYQTMLELEVLGSFDDHDDYNGIFLGISDSNWHLEFTTSSEVSNHITGEDDFLVFYVKSKAEQDAIREKCIVHNVPLITAKNPYWNKNGLIFNDPDNYKIIVAVSNKSACIDH